MMLTQLLHAALIAVAFCGTAADVAAQPATFPTKPMTLVVPFAPGGTSDFVARVLAEKVGAKLGQPMIVDNRSGADGIIGAQYVAKAPADGYTLLQISTTHVIQPSLRQELPYDWKKNLQPVAGWIGVPQVLIVNAKSKVQSLKDLVALAKGRPGGINFGSGGTGTLGHLTGEMVLKSFGAPVRHIPYRGLGPALQAVLGDQVDVAIANLPEVMPQVKGGRLRALAITTEQRWPELPDVPTAKELGVRDGVSLSWTSILAPSGTPPAVVKLLHDSFEQATNEPDVKARLTQAGAEVRSLGAADLERFLASEAARWREVVITNGIKVE